ncbi:uncharacterized protein BXZ73DRAFT_77999 [Epithele typhae]|uniref:uncharacterized protein n=1 Tax=Epithele typhae TaxID=378194 RepID=UPI0020082626|nr:uncharacterized protein BXZ73DRAFT_77999 [Epithele typhae]KAH9929885.1 hypothetical protein BXZ73DRAFT_77999 [Epithele typhae]
MTKSPTPKSDSNLVTHYRVQVKPEPPVESTLGASGEIAKSIIPAHAPVNDLEPAPHAALGVDLSACLRLENLTLSFDFAPVADAAAGMWDLLRVVRATLALYIRVLVPQVQAFPALREIALQVFCATAAPAAFACSTSAPFLGEPRPRDGKSVRMRTRNTLDAALGALPALETVRFLMCDVERSSEAETVEAMGHFVGEQLPRTCRFPLKSSSLTALKCSLGEPRAPLIGASMVLSGHPAQCHADLMGFRIFFELLLPM